MDLLPSQWRKRGLPVSVNGFRSVKATYSQCGEDAVLAWLFNATELEGLYLDIGCYDPVRWSNTYHFYRRGWHGVTVDASTAHARAWKQTRPRDRHLVAAVIPTPEYGPVRYVEGPHAATNHVVRCGTLPSHGTAASDTPSPRVLSMAHLGDWWQEDRAPDLVSTDVEGMDQDLILNYPFTTLAPRVLVVEFGELSSGDPGPTRLGNNGYRLVARVGPSWIWAAH